MNNIISKVKELLKDKGNIVVGMSGISLSGKSTISKNIKEKLQTYNIKVALVSFEENNEIMDKAMLDKNPSKHYYESAFDFDKINQDVKELSKINDVVIVEGLFLFKNTVNIDFDFRIWIDCTFTTSINRAKNINKESINLYEDFYMWAQRMHFSIDEPTQKSDLIYINDEILHNKEVEFVNLKQNPSSVETMKWLYEPKAWKLENNELYIETDAITDFWQRTHYGFRNDNAHFMYIETEKDFEMYTKVKFNPIHQFDQCGLCVRIDEDNWVKTSIEYELENPPKLGGVVTNLGYSDWSTQELDYGVSESEFKITREGQDYKIECRLPGKEWTQLRICHLHDKTKKVMCGIYTCSPIDNGYKVWFEDIKIQEKYF